MDRETEIELMQKTEERARARTASWLADPEVKKVLRKNHQATREMYGKDAAPRRAKGGSR